MTMNFSYSSKMRAINASGICYAIGGMCHPFQRPALLVFLLPVEPAAAVRAGRREPELTLGRDLATAVEKLRGLRKQGLSVSDYLAQSKLFPELTPFQENLLTELDKRRHSGRKVADLLSAYDMPRKL